MVTCWPAQRSEALGSPPAWRRSTVCALLVLKGMPSRTQKGKAMTHNSRLKQPPPAQQPSVHPHEYGPDLEVLLLNERFGSGTLITSAP